jgi:hypothetical protein
MARCQIELFKLRSRYITNQRSQWTPRNAKCFVPISCVCQRQPRSVCVRDSQEVVCVSEAAKWSHECPLENTGLITSETAKKAGRPQARACIESQRKRIDPRVL